MRPPAPDPTGPGQESVWDYPRPAVAQPSARHIRIEHRGIVLADTRHTVRTLETSHPPSYYLPPSAIAMTALHQTTGGSFCEWKGQAIYYDVIIGGERLPAVAWSYPAPTAPFAALRGYVAFYAAPFDGCFIDGERVVPQPGGFYGGWITSDIIGPFKGVAGSRFW